MKRGLGIIAAAAIAGCAGTGEESAGSAGPAAPTPPVVDTTWAAEALAGQTPAPGGRFQLILGSDGRIGGRSGCNNFSARYELKDGAFKVYPPMIGTKMACPEAVMAQESLFTSVIETATSAAVGADGKLTVTGADGRALRFSAAAPPPQTADESAPPMPVPSHIVMRCGAEQLRVRLADDKAYVVPEDGAEVELSRLTGTAGSAETYTNGRMTLERTTAPQHGFRFARGRAALMPCILAVN